MYALLQHSTVAPEVRWMGLKWLVFYIGPLDLIGMWFGEDQRANIVNTTCLKEIVLRF